MNSRIRVNGRLYERVDRPKRIRVNGQLYEEVQMNELFGKKKNKGKNSYKVSKTKFTKSEVTRWAKASFNGEQDIQMFTQVYTSAKVTGTDVSYGVAMLRNSEGYFKLAVAKFVDDTDKVREYWASKRDFDDLHKADEAFNEIIKSRVEGALDKNLSKFGLMLYPSR